MLFKEPMVQTPLWRTPGSRDPVVSEISRADTLEVAQSQPLLTSASETKCCWL